jgi:hypothetical protein
MMHTSPDFAAQMQLTDVISPIEVTIEIDASGFPQVIEQSTTNAGSLLFSNLNAGNCSAYQR